MQKQYGNFAKTEDQKINMQRSTHSQIRSKTMFFIRTTPSSRTNFPAVITHLFSEHLKCQNQKLETI
jgi:hypothetical protein